MKKNVLALLFAVSFSGIFLAGCAKKESKSKLPYSLRIAKIGASALISPLISISEENGYFEKYGLSTTMGIVDDSTSIAILGSGKIDTIFQQMNQQLAAADQGAHITVFAGNRSGGVYVLSRIEDAETLKDPRNWVGKRIGALAPISNLEFILGYQLEHDYGIDTEKELIYRRFDGHQSALMALQRGDVDIAFADPPALDGARPEERGLKILYPLTHIQEGYVCCRQMAWTDALEEKPEAFKAYLKAQILAYKDYTTNREKAIRDIAAATNQTVEYTARNVYDRETNGDRVHSPDPNYNGTLAQYESMIKYGYTPGNRPLYEIFNISIYADALKEILAEYPDDPVYKELWAYFISHNDKYPDFAKNYL